MKTAVSAVAIASIAFTGVGVASASSASAATPVNRAVKVGAKCPKKGKVKYVKQYDTWLQCKKVKGKLKWKKAFPKLQPFNTL